MNQASTFAALSAAGVPDRVLELEHAMSRPGLPWDDWDRLLRDRATMLGRERQHHARRAGHRRSREQATA